MVNLRKQLEKYFNTTPKEKLEEDWNEIKQWNDVGPDAIEYCKWIMENYKE